MSQLTNYIQKELDKGFAKNLITKKLLQAGYTPQEITDSFKSLKSAEPILRRKFADTLHLETHIQWSKWIFGLLAIVVVIVLGFLVYQYGGELPSYREESISSCDSLSGGEKDICYLQLSANGQDYCSQIQNLALKTACDNKIWESDDCTYELFLGEDYDACLFQKAIETKDTTYCTILEEHSDCLYELAIAANDSSLCEGDGYCLTLYALKQKDPTACSIIQNFFLSDCYDTYARETGDITVCEKGSVLCGFPYDGNQQDKNIFIEQKLNELSEGIEEGHNYSKRDWFLNYVAMTFQEILYCSEIAYTPLKEQCMDDLT